jgi:hypothetical protein
MYIKEKKFCLLTWQNWHQIFFKVIEKKTGISIGISIINDTVV